MIKLHPKYVYDQDEKVGVILSIDEFEYLLDELENVHDYELIRVRKLNKEKTYTLAEVKASLSGKK